MTYKYYPNNNHFDNLVHFYFRHVDSYTLRNGNNWYKWAKNDAQQIADKHNITLEAAAAVIAVISPNVEWAINLRIADKIINDYNQGKRPENGRYVGYPENILKAYDILRNGLKIGYNLRGRKVVPFFYNILLAGDYNQPVIDIHMVRILRADFRIKHNGHSLNNKDHTDMVTAVKTLAKILECPVSQLQAALWVTVKRINRKV